MLESCEYEHHDREPDSEDLSDHILGSGLQPARKDYQDVAANTSEYGRHERDRSLGSRDRHCSLTCGIGKQSALSQNEREQYRSDQIAYVYDHPVFKHFARCDLLIHQSKCQKVVACEELSPAQDDHHQADREQSRSDKLGDHALERIASCSRCKHEHVRTESDICSGKHPEDKHFAHGQVRLLDSVINPYFSDLCW